MIAGWRPCESGDAGRGASAVDFVMFGMNDWYEWESTGFRTRCGTLARALAERADVGNVLVVSTARSSAVNSARLALGRVTGRVDPRATEDPYRPRVLDGHVSVLDHTRLLPRDERFEWTYRVNGWLSDERLRGAVRSACSSLGMEEVVLWVANPLAAKHIGRLGEVCSVFDAVDDWSRHPQLRHVEKSVRAGYDVARERAQIIFTVSESLRSYLGDKRTGVYWQPNGVDSARFQGARRVPDDVEGLERPIVGYVGVIQERVDVGLVVELARAMPEATMVFVGPILAPQHIRPLACLDNVRLLGSRDPSAIPAYVHSFDVCIVPHVDDAFTRSMDPLKVYEYLAAGKPVVARGVAGMGEPEGLIHRAASADDFIAAVRSIAREDRGSPMARMAFARSRSWGSRVDEMLAIIEAHVANVREVTLA